MYEDLCYVENDNCIKGVVGDGEIIGEYWRTVNRATQIAVKDDSIVISHNGMKSTAQVQVVQNVENDSALKGKAVTFSVWARVVVQNSNHKGGTIAIINAKNYNQGKFFAKIDFDNTEWERISVTAKMPADEEYQGVTVCMRALTVDNGGQHAVVEFSDPKLEVGSFATKY